MHQFCLVLWSVYLEESIVSSRLSENSFNTEKALGVFQALLMKTRKYLPLPVGVGLVAEYLLSMLKVLGSNVNMSNNDVGMLLILTGEDM